MMPMHPAQAKKKLKTPPSMPRRGVGSSTPGGVLLKSMSFAQVNTPKLATRSHTESREKKPLSIRATSHELRLCMFAVYTINICEVYNGRKYRGNFKLLGEI